MCHMNCKYERGRLGDICTKPRHVKLCPHELPPCVQLGASKRDCEDNEYYNDCDHVRVCDEVQAGKFDDY